MTRRDVDDLLGDLLVRSGEQREAKFSTEGAVQTRKRLLAQVWSLVDGFSALRDETAPRLLESVECDGYTRQRIELGFVSGMTFNAYVLVPHGADSERRPAMIATHGHGYGSRQVCGLLAGGSPDLQGTDGHQHFALQLVRRGFLVIAPDVVGFGERQSAGDEAFDPEPTNSCYRLSMSLLMHGLTLTGLRSAELLGVVSYLMTRPDVDADRVGIAGFSGGSLLSLIVSVLDERLAATLLMSFPNTFAESILAVRHCACNYAPGILTEAELPDLIGLVAPRPLFLESGSADPIFPADGFRRAVDQVAKTYREVGAPEVFGSDLHAGGHEVSGRHAFDWLASVLRADALVGGRAGAV